MKQYRINPGHSFRMGDGQVKGHGEVIDLADDVAAANPGAVDEVKPAVEPAGGDAAPAEPTPT